MKKLFTAFILLLMLTCGARTSAQSVCDSIVSHLNEHPFGYFVTDSVPLRFYYSGKNLIPNPTVSIELEDTSEVVVRGSATVSDFSDDNDTVSFPALDVTFKTKAKGVNTIATVKLSNPNLSPPLYCEYQSHFYFHRPNTCDSMKVSPHEVYTNLANDTVVLSLVYWGENFVNYPKISLLLDDTTDFVAREGHQFFGLQDSMILPFHLIHKTNNIPTFLYGRLIMEDGLGNGEDSCVMAVVIRFNKTNGISPDRNGEGFKFYPNPASGGVINISAPEDGKLQILNMVGQELINYDVFKGLNKISLNLQHGQYMIVFITPRECRKGYLLVH